MINTEINCVILILVAALVTFFLRALPFIIFSRNGQMPETVKRAANSLPPAIIAVLVVYCVRADALDLSERTIAMAVSLCLVIAIHVLKRNTLLSVFTGTILYMVLIRLL